MNPIFNYERHKVRAGSFELRYWDEGSPDAQTTLVLLHGIGSSAENWSWVMPYLTAHYRIIALDLPGYGLSPIPAAQEQKTLSLETTAHILEQVITQLGLAKFVLVGHSMGAGIALQYSLDYPEHVQKLVLIAPNGFGKHIDFGSKLLTLPGVELLFKPSRALIKSGLRQIVRQPIIEEDTFVDIMYHQYRRPGAWQWHLALLRIGINFGGQKKLFTSRELSGFQVKTLLIWGSHDPLFPIAHAQSAHKRIPASTLHIIDDVGHNPPIEKPKIVVDFIENFVQAG
ncbi:alpha/beta fold hydrolase [Chloroflexota bacterium]